MVEPEEIEHARIMDIGKSYLGKLHGQYTDWTPLVRRNLLFPEPIDETDPWQFQNFRVCGTTRTRAGRRGLPPGLDAHSCVLFALSSSQVGEFKNE